MTTQNSGISRSALVTGGAGFIGSHLCERLVSLGRRVVVVDNLSTGREANLAALADASAAGHAVTLIDADASAALAPGGPAEAEGPFDEVYHLAAAVGVDLVLDDPVGSIEANVGLTHEALRFAERQKRQAGAPPVVLIASSSEVYGKPNTRVFSEDDDVLYGPTTATRWSYAASKAIDEYLALGYHASRGVPVVVVRFFNTVGPRQIGRYGMVLPRFVSAALAGEPLRVFGDGEQTRCFCDVRDVAQALPALIEREPCRGRVFNVGGDRPISIRGLADAVIAELQSTSTIQLVPYGEAYSSGFEDLRHRRPDLSRVREAIGFEPRVPLATTINDIAAHLRQAGGAG